jgi:hypothetical protein
LQRAVQFRLAADLIDRAPGSVHVVGFRPHLPIAQKRQPRAAPGAVAEVLGVALAVPEQTVEARTDRVDERLEMSVRRTVTVAEHEQLRRDLVPMQVPRRRQHHHAAEVTPGQRAERQDVVARRILTQHIHAGLQRRHALRVELCDDGQCVLVWHDAPQTVNCNVK